MRARTGRPQITDVAARAGVSSATVSRVMNGVASVAPELAERVRDAARDLGYAASPLARGLAVGRTRSVAVVVPDLGNPSFQEALRGITRAAARDGYRVLVADTAEDVAQERVMATEARRHCDAVILCAPRMPEDELAQVAAELAPMVLLHRNSDVGVPVVLADYRAGILDLAEHLHTLGHRRMAYLAGPAPSTSNRHRLAGIEQLVRAHPDVTVRTLPGGVSFADGHAALDAVLASGATAVLAFNDLVAMGLLSALHEAGTAVPRTLSVTGFDDIVFAAYTTPPLTTAAVPTADLGEQAWARLAALLAGDVPDDDVLVHPRLVVRGSTGPAPVAAGPEEAGGTDGATDADRSAGGAAGRPPEPPADPLAGYEDWPAWARTRPRRRAPGPLADRVTDALGVVEPVHPAPVVTTLARREVDGVLLERVEWHVGFGPRTRGWVARPDTADVLPGVLALHCHGGVKSVGADQLVTLDGDASPQAVRLQRDYYGDRAPAVELARRGFVVLAHDAFAWGSRRFPLEQRSAKLTASVAAIEALWREQGLDPDADTRYDAAAGVHEDTVAKAAGVLGTSLTGTVVHDDLVALDVLAGLPGVDPERLGAFGFSGGGGRSALLAVLDERVRAHVVTCMMSTFDALVPRYLDAHSWLLWGPALPGLGEWPDLLAPRPGRSVLVQYALRDQLFPEAGMRAAHARLTAMYAHAAGYRASFWDRPHVFDAGMQDEAFAFLAAEIGAPPAS